ncbi:MAG: 2-C-methyl-D-erythritol 2,4-cyclodiphosphate synthase [Clostridiales Family XIII bacterium]|jgi:2-C-methyl-D-erythritol 2,4-cyclodiphosphate synthase/2-C-methyl-D-erythritol 4-phosphate cytidylyltransferase|nr:2-C-methyl-D-erythritol 2,4-cyclodiphosphate synthase [Clostridiales Family XIII bacterium]
MYNGKRVTVLLAAAGSGSRIGGEIPKQFMEVEGKPMLLVAAEAFSAHEAVDAIYVILPEGHAAQGAALLGGVAKLAGQPRGASTRQGSVYAGLKAMEADGAGEGIVLIHDAARPFVSSEILDRVLERTAQAGAAVPVVPVTDTVYMTEQRRPTAEELAEGALEIGDIPKRERLFCAQTPQGFYYDIILWAHELAAESEFTGTDDAALVRRAGWPVYLVPGETENRKITVPGDLGGIETRAGTGFDVHRLTEGRPLILGGVEIPFDKGLLGHSDADVLTHALMDAMLGALALGDIGQHFPDTDPQYEGISSMKLLAEVKQMIEARGWRVGNADLTILAERPRMAGFVPAVQESLARALGITPGDVGVKATTTEGLGFTGREEGIGAQAVVLLKRA